MKNQNMGRQYQELNWQQNVFKKSIKKKVKFRKLESHLNNINGKMCLDIGCGTGIIGYFLRTKGGNWTNIDVDKHKVMEAKKLIGKSIVVGNATTLPFKQHIFDCIVAFDVIEHLYDDEKFLREIFELLNPNGELYITTPNTEGFLILNKLKAMVGFTLEHSEHIRAGYTPTELERELERRGFEVTDTTTYSKFFTEFLELIINRVYLKLSKNRSIVPVTSQDLDKTSFKLYSFFYPFLWQISLLDNLLFFTQGYGLMVCAKKTPNRDGQ